MPVSVSDSSALFVLASFLLLSKVLNYSSWKCHDHALATCLIVIYPPKYIYLKGQTQDFPYTL